MPLNFLGREGILLNQQQGLDVLEIAESQSIRYSDWQHLGKVKDSGNAIKDHVDAVINLPLVSISKIRRRKYKVVVDCINGAGSLILPHLLRKLGCEVIEINCALSGAFTHNPEPTGQSLQQLSQAVRRHKADIGFATDPDGDRLAVVDEHGKPWGEEYTLVAAVDYFLRKKKTAVVTNVSTTRAIDDIALRYQCAVFRAAVGEVNVIQKMIAVNSLIGGEGNGGVIVSDLHYGRDSVVGILLILQSLTEQQISAGKLRASFPDYHIIKEKIEVDSLFFSKISRILEKSIGDYPIDYTDGLKILGPDWWVHLRKSNTEPIVRLIVEAKTIKKAEALKNEYLQKIKESRRQRV
ncbi:MAG: phosphoglucosamine mutase [Patescibacteria group bacterium]|nr:phosphoglucosamine mutase [Patescibacteria group bacterium]